ncbi:MAG: POTRA domain-containing protein, partial [Acidobacteriota bacterium]
TIGNDITDSLFLIYSMNLVDAGDQILSIEYDITRNFQTKLTRQSDNSYRFELGQALRFGIPKETSSESQSSKKKIDSVEITGNPIFPNEQLLDRFKVKAGDTYDFFKIQKGLEKLEKYYTDRNYLEAKISLKRTEPDSRLELILQIEAGPEVEMRYLGWNPDKDTKKQVISAWAKGLFDAQRIQNSRQELWSSLAGKGYLEAQIQSKIQSNASGSKAVVFDMDIGTRYRNVDIEFNGAFGIPPFRLEKALEDEKLIEKIHSAPEETIEFLEKFYRFNGYLNAVVQSFQYELNPDTATGKTIIPIQEGSLFRIHALEFEGNSALTRSQMMEEIPLSPGGVYDPVELRESVDRIEKLYWSLGYNNVILDYELKRSEEDADSMKILLRITENSQQYVQEIVVDGNRKTSTSMILSQINLKEGDILDYRETNKSRSHLYDTRAYTFVDIQPKPFSGPQLPSESNRRPVQLKVTVKEVSPFRFVYSSFYDTERGVGGIADFSNRNSLGNARLVGTRVRLDADVQEIRGYFSQPFLRRFPINTDVTGYFRRESTLDEEISNIRFSTDRIGISLQQEVKFQNKFILSYGYRFEHKRQREITSGSVVETIQNTAPLTITLTRESRNNLLDSWKGSLLSQAFEYAPSYLGSDLRYDKYLGQYFYYLPLLSPSRVPWVGEKRSRLVLANGIRVGLAGGFDGQDLLESDKFFAGGGTTIRGFSQNTISPLGPEGEPVGGNALFIVNSELRFPIYSIFDGVGPYFLLRADYGLKLDRQPGESKGEFFFSIGQAF